MKGRAQLELLRRVVERETHVLTRSPEWLTSHLHNVLFLDEGEEGVAAPILGRAREALSTRPWLRLTNRPQAAISRLSPVLTLDHGDAVNGIAWSPDGRLLASSGRKGRVVLWNAATGQIEGALGDDGIGPVAWSPDGAVLAAGLGRHVSLWNPWTREEVALITHHEAPVQALAWSPNGCTLATGSADRTVGLWDRKGRQQQLLQTSFGEVSALAWSPDGMKLAWGDITVRVMEDDGEYFSVGGGAVWLWDGLAGLVRRITETEGDEISALTWSPDGSFLAAAGRQTIHMFDGTLEAPIRVAQGHQDKITALAWSPDGATLASGSAHEDRQVLLWDADLEGAPRRAGTHSHAISGLAWAPDGRVLASASWDGTVRLWDPDRAAREGPSEVGILTEMLSWSADCTRLASVNVERGASSESATASIRLWDASTGEEVGPPDQSAGAALAWSPDGRMLATGGWDQMVRVSDSATGALLAEMAFGEPVLGLCFSPDSTKLAAGTSTGGVLIRELGGPESPTRLRVLRRLSGEVRTIEWSPHGRKLAWAGSGAFEDYRVMLWDHQGGRPLSDLRGATSPVRALAWSSDETWLAAGEQNGTVRLWNLVSGGDTVLEGHPRSVDALAWSRDGFLFASGSSDGSVRLWAVTDGRPLLVGRCLSAVGAVCFRSIGRMLCAADDGAVTGNRPVPYLFEVCNLQGHDFASRPPAP